MGGRVGADGIGANPGQVAIAWVSAKGVLPILGPRTRAQLDENLVAATLKLDNDHIRRLDEVSAVPLGYPHELFAAADQRATMTGNRWDQIEFPERTVAANPDGRTGPAVPEQWTIARDNGPSRGLLPYAGVK